MLLGICRYQDWLSGSSILSPVSSEHIFNSGHHLRFCSPWERPSANRFRNGLDVTSLITPDPPMSCHGGSPNIKNNKKLLKMTPGWIPDLPNKCQITIWNLFQKRLRLPSGLPQVAPKTPNDHQQMPNEFQKITNTCHRNGSNNVASITKNVQTIVKDLQVAMDFSRILHRYLGMIHGELQKPFVCFSHPP